MEEEHREPRPDLAPCARCGRQVKNPKFIGSLIVGRDCRRKMLKEGFSEGVHKCPLCHNILPDEHKLSVKDGKVVLEPTIKRRSLDEFSGFTPPMTGPATFELLSVEVIHEDGSVTPLGAGKKGEGSSDDGEKPVDGGDEASG